MSQARAVSADFCTCNVPCLESCVARIAVLLSRLLNDLPTLRKQTATSRHTPSQAERVPLIRSGCSNGSTLLTLHLSHCCLQRYATPGCCVTSLFEC